MSLKIYYSDKIEELAEHLKGELLAERLNMADPFVFSQIVVPNKNIAKWLQIGVFSKTPGLCAGIQFPFMEKRLTDLLMRNLPKGRPFSLLPDNAYANAIMATLLNPDNLEFDSLSPFRSYISDGAADRPLDITTQKSARMAWQLATKLADLMDQYEVRRPEIVENWLKGGNANGTGAPTLGSAEAGEAALARALWGPNGAFPEGGDRLSLRQLYDCVKNAVPEGPSQKVYFFGQSTLSLLQVRILVWLAQTHEVVFYHNNVCLEYWGDIETKEERIKLLGRNHAAKEDIPGIENPLLRQWGIAGRETMRLLVDLEEENDGRVDFTWESVADSNRETPRTLLGKIQDSVWHRTGETEKTPQDASLQIVGAPGIRREVEMVYNAIIGAVWKPGGSGERPWEECSFSDIAVLVPDMAKYRPVIEAVFDARDEVPYGLVDTTASEDSTYLAGFLAIADMARRGLTRETLFAVLDNPCVQAALKFSSNDVAEWREITANVGAFDGFETREGESLYNWDWALSRMRLAMVADEVAMEEGTGNGEEGTGKMIPLVPVNNTSAMLLSEIVELLYRRTEEAFRDENTGAPRHLPCAARLDGEANSDSPTWSRVLVRLANDFLDVPEDSELEGSVRRQIFQTLGGLSSIPGEQGFEFPIAAVEHFVGGIACRKGGYLTDGVTIAGLQPMRPVPFKQVFVLGLGEGGFPGRTGTVDTLDVRGAGWKLGDVSLPKVNRYLFLETLMAVRDRLVLSYPNRDIEKDAELFPSGIVRELEDFAGTIVESGKFNEFKGYPLLERGERNAPKERTPVCDVKWVPDDPFAGILPTYSKWARAVASDASANYLDTGEGSASGDHARREVSARELAEFLKSPLRAVLRFGFGIAEEGYRDNELDIDSPLGISDGPVKWGLQEDWLKGNCELEKPFRELQLTGQTPIGFLGDFARDGFEKDIAENKDAMLAFAKEFGFGEDKNCTMRQSIPATLSREGNAATDVLYTSATPNWREAGTGVSVFILGHLGSADAQALPPERTLESLVAFLMFVSKQNPEAGGWHLRVGMLDVENGAMAVWRWIVEPQEAGDYLERLTLRYFSYLDLQPGEDAYVDFTYRKFVKALAGADIGDDASIDWESVLERLTAEEFNTGGSSFNKDLVVEQAVGKYRRDPTAAELETLYDDFYKLPVMGRKESAETSEEGEQ